MADGGSGPNLWDYVAMPITWLLRPRFSVSRIGDRCRERVDWEQGGRCMALRLKVNNHGRTRARECEVRVTEIMRDRRVLDRESSRLQWVDRDGFEPITILRGDVGATYVNICGVDEATRALVVFSEKLQKGYHRFSEPGEYVISFEIHAASPSLAHHGQITVKHEGDWERAQIVKLENTERWARRHLAG